MTEEDTIAIGDYCESVMAEPAFNFVTQQFELQMFAQFRDSAPPNTKEREHIFAKLSGLRDFLAHMAAFVSAKDKILELQALSNSPDADAPIDGID